MKNAIHYDLLLHDPAAHLFTVKMTLAAPAPEGQLLLLPAWIPGSYMVREFARNIVRIRAEAGGKELALTKRDKHSWQAAPCAGALTVYYEVYAWDLSVRTAHFDQTHAFFNGSSLFLRAAGHEQAPHVVELRRPAGAAYKNWRVATALPELGRQALRLRQLYRRRLRRADRPSGRDRRLRARQLSRRTACRTTS